MKTTDDRNIETLSANETLAASVPVNSPGMTYVEALVLLRFGDSPGYGGSIKVSGTFTTDADGLTVQVGQEQVKVLLSETLRGLSTNLQVPRVYLGVTAPVNGQPGPINLFVQGPRDTPMVWRVSVVSETL